MVLKKPENWETMLFIEKLKWYAKKDNKVKNMFADKYKIKHIIDELNLPNLHYAKTFTHVKPVAPDHDFNILVPIEHELKPLNCQLSKETISIIINEIETPEQFWTILKEKYNIYPVNDINTFPKSYVYKLNLGWNTMAFVTNNKLVKIVAGTKVFEPTPKNLFHWKKFILKHYIKKTPPKIFVEEFIGYNLRVFEIYCIYGKPRIMSVYYETDASYESNYLVTMPKNKEVNKRNIVLSSLCDDTYDDTAIEPTLMDHEDEDYEEFNLKLIPNCHLIQGANPLIHTIDDCIAEEMCEYAKIFASYFEFIRVDFYYHKNKIYFSECTFKPGALNAIKWGSIGNFLSTFWSREPLL